MNLSNLGTVRNGLLLTRLQTHSIYIQVVLIKIPPFRSTTASMFLRICLEILRHYSGVILAFHTFCTTLLLPASPRGLEGAPADLLVKSAAFTQELTCLRRRWFQQAPMYLRPARP